MSEPREPLPGWLAAIEIRIKDALPTESACAQIAHDAQMVLELCKAQRWALKGMVEWFGGMADDPQMEIGAIKAVEDAEDAERLWEGK